MIMHVLIHWNIVIYAILRATFYKKKFSFGLSLEWFNRGEKLLAQRTDCKSDYASLLIDKAGVWEKLEETAKMSSAYEKARVLCKSAYGENHVLYANFLMKQAKQYISHGLYNKARYNVDKVLKIANYNKSISKSFRLFAESKLASLHYRVGQYDAAFKHAQVVLEKVPDTIGVLGLIRGTSLETIGLVYKKRQNYKKSLLYFQQPIQLYKRINGYSSQRYKLMLSNLIECNMKVGNMVRAKNLLNEQLEGAVD